MSLVRQDDFSTWRFTERSRKYAGRILEEIVQLDPGYVQWAWKEESKNDRTDGFYAIEDMLQKYGIALE